MTYDNRTNLLAHALQLFANHGYDAVSVQEIVEAAGVTKPTLYHYFASKRGVLDALLEERGGELIKVVTQASIYDHDLPLTLEKIVMGYFGFAREQPLFYRLMLSLWSAPSVSEGHKAITPLLQKQHGLIENVFMQATRDHGNMRGRHQAYAATLLGMINTYVSIALNGYMELTLEVAHQALRQFMYGIYS